MIHTTFFILFAIACSLSHAVAAERQAFVPVKPGELLKVLPNTPAGWRLTRSEAETNFGQWYESRAMRSFEAPADATDGQGAGRVEISVADTGSFSSAIAAFADFKIEKTEGFEKVMIGAIPAMHFAGPNGERATQALINQRYLVEILIAGLPQQTAVMWLRTLKFSSLPAQAGPIRVVPPKEVVLQFVDELKPANSRSHTVAVTNAESLEQKLKSLPQLPESASKENAVSAQAPR